MSEVFVTMAMSLDGFITGPHDDVQNLARPRHQVMAYSGTGR
jgi:hypothetical protein